MVEIERKLFIALFSSLVVISATAQNVISLKEVREAGLRVVEITTLNGEEPQGDSIKSPVREDTYNYIYKNKVPCQVVITLNSDTLYDSGAYEKDSAGAVIRINGNTSAFYSHILNMPYKLKLENKEDLLGRGDHHRYADKNWRLLKNPFTLNTIIGMKLSEMMGMEWTAAFVPCNVVINGNYRGCYLLTETVRRNNQCRIAVDKEQGFIVERDPYWWKENRWFCTSWYEQSDTYRWTWKYPEEDEVTEEKEHYICEFINQAEQSIANGGDYGKYIDVKSFARWLLAQDILGTRDSGGSNMFLKKYDQSDTTRLSMPCLWDFDSNFTMTAGSFSRQHTSQNAYFGTLLQSKNTAFLQAYVNLWHQALSDSLFTRLSAFIDHYVTSAEGRALDVSRRLYNRRFNYSYSSIETYARIAQQWFANHPVLLGSQIEELDTFRLSAIMPVEATRTKTVRYYDLRGIRSLKTPRAIIKRSGNNAVVYQP